jgi:hypothetical protein
VGSTPAQTAAPLNARCDGGVYCSQMTSCAEARFPLRNWSGVKMDGDGNGVPCEHEWCTWPGAKQVRWRAASQMILAEVR